mmetsp:Transcript_11266/g.15608  ORF Transcript_11266/g.15608 Transcript_11266/m.15608 type:complete len:87 (-) Transcript_11266:27-287(-)
MVPTICFASGYVARWEPRLITVFTDHSTSQFAMADMASNLFMKLTPPIWWVAPIWVHFARVVVNESIISKREPPDYEDEKEGKGSH